MISKELGLLYGQRGALKNFVEKRSMTDGLIVEV